MAYQGGNNGYPPPRDGESSYPPPPGEDEERRYQSHQHQRALSSSGGVTLPSISPYDPQYAHHQQPQQHQPPPNGYSPDPRGYQQDPYHGQPGGSGPYRDDRAGYPPQDYGRGSGGGQPQQPMNFAQSAPRQRTAIACRYCRRRKIRCSGFEQGDGRCSNCQRFQQECIFTPVSSQAQAFIPAHVVYPHMRPTFDQDGRQRPVAGYQGTQQLYGAHGQPLGPIPMQGAPYNGPPPAQAGSPYGYGQPSPTSSYSSFNDERDRQQKAPNASESSRKRSQEEPHPSILPPPMPGQPGPQTYPRAGSSTRRPAAEDDPRLAPITPTAGQASSNYSPGSSTSSNSGLQPPGQSTQTGSSRTPPPRGSPSDRADPMSMGNILQGNGRSEAHIDRGMLSRLDRKK